ncbi:MAG: hypothetical protein KAS32_26465 [Candidatus Peribacteraceae bacterium]|nr:hypothetical protein [Candidatus Peribacteraceae bacterium]
MKKYPVAKYVLIWDTGDSTFTTQKDALRYAKYLKNKGHKLDGLYEYRYLGKKYKTNPKIFKQWKR